MATQPTTEQHAWLKAHPQFARTSHVRGKFTQRGTLHADGRFVLQDDKNPIIDGNGAFGVGILAAPPRRR